MVRRTNTFFVIDEPGSLDAVDKTENDSPSPDGHESAPVPPRIKSHKPSHSIMGERI
jgi:hypothetical protein